MRIIKFSSRVNPYTFRHWSAKFRDSIKQVLTAIITLDGVLDLCFYVSIDSRRMALRCRNM
jgi:hypothetical protein